MQVRWWWFWGVGFGMGEILLGVLGVVLSDFKEIMQTVTISSLSSYTVLLLVLRPYDP